MTHHATRWLILLLIGAMPWIQGCDNSTADPSTDSAKDVGVEPENQRRVVSLSPALTRMIVDLGMGNTLVGVVDNDPAAPAELNVTSVGAYPNINSEILISLKPTHVVLMVGAEGVPTNLESLAGANGIELVQFKYPSTVLDVSKILMGEFSSTDTGLVSEQSLGGALGDELLAFTLGTGMNQTLGEIANVTHTVPYDEKPRVLVVFKTTPQFMASGPGTVLHDLLTQYCRAENAAIPNLKPPKNIDDSAQFKQAMQDPAKTVGTAPVFDKERLLEANPDVILLLLPGEPPLSTIDDDPRLMSLRGLDIPAVKNNRIILISDPMTLLPSSSLPSTALAMSKAIHPQLAEQLDRAVAVEEDTDDKGDATNKSTNHAEANEKNKQGKDDKEMKDLKEKKKDEKTNNPTPGNDAVDTPTDDE